MVSTKNIHRLVVLGTGGTIAGKAQDSADNVSYQPAQLGIDQLIGGLPGLQARLGSHQLQCEQVAQVDSKDMSFDIWRDLAARVSEHLADEDVRGLVITHGTDTLEETAYFLHRVLPATLLEKAGCADLCHAPGQQFESGRPAKFIGFGDACLGCPGARGHGGVRWRSAFSA